MALKVLLRCGLRARCAHGGAGNMRGLANVLQRAIVLCVPAVEIKPSHRAEVPASWTEP